MRWLVAFLFLVFIGIQNSGLMAQLSPGELCGYHAHLEGLSNCTQCHVLGEKVSNEKCLACHTELKNRIIQNKGFHASAEVKGKACNSCHSDHHGKNFQIIRFDPKKFNHASTGFILEGMHAKRECGDCHKAEYIKNPAAKKKKFSYLGLDQDCISCHTDYHQNTLGHSCKNCHSATSFKPAGLFSHDRTKFELKGRHATLGCEKCHKVVLKEGKVFQEFAGLKFGNCSDCHKDIHHGRFGSNCKQCHTESGFSQIKATGGFDHGNTSFKLTGKHQAVACKNCHKNKVTDPLQHTHCTDCHKDYHEKQFVVNGLVRDCSECHTTLGFSPSGYSLEQHNRGPFFLEKAHAATACFACHKKTGKWNFRGLGQACLDCHKNIHEEGVSPDLFRYSSCQSCHNPSSWSVVQFDHNQTKFPLSPPHLRQSCRKCHFINAPDGKAVSVFAGRGSACTQCHKDVHRNQFSENGLVDCLKCHKPEKWRIDQFDHDRTGFRLDGRHRNVACIRCHKWVTEGTERYILYKTSRKKCEDCH